MICHYIGRGFQWYLMTYEYDEEKSLGTVSAVLFYILALQTGLTSLSPDKRFVRLCRNLCLLVTALFHFLHNIVSPILMSLSAARNPSRKRHVRSLSVCAFLILMPVSLLYYLWAEHSPSTWLLAVTAFSVEVIVKVSAGKSPRDSILIPQIFVRSAFHWLHTRSFCLMHGGNPSGRNWTIIFIMFEPLVILWSSASAFCCSSMAPGY